MSDPITLEPGNKTGPTTHGVEDLIAQDPNAHWDDACQCVKGSTQPVSPRVITIPVYDPSFFETGTQNGRNADLKVANFIGFFIEGFDADGNPFGRITRRDGLRSEDCKNGADDDGDGAVDCADSDCANDPGCQPVP
jgi:hypothetical protein